MFGVPQVCITVFSIEYLGRVLSVPFSSFLDSSTQLGIDIFKRKHVYLGDSRGNRLWSYVTEVRLSHCHLQRPPPYPSIPQARLLTVVCMVRGVGAGDEFDRPAGHRTVLYRARSGERFAAAVPARDAPDPRGALAPPLPLPYPRAPASRQFPSHDSRRVSPPHATHLRCLNPITGPTAPPHLC